MLTEYNIGGTHEENRYGGIPIGIGANGKPNLVEEGETRDGNFIFSNKVYPFSKEQLRSEGLPIGKGSYADLSKKLDMESRERPNDPISTRGRNIMMERLKQSQERTKALQEQIKAEEQMALEASKRAKLEQMMLGKLDTNLGEESVLFSKEMPLEGISDISTQEEPNTFRRGGKLRYATIEQRNALLNSIQNEEIRNNISRIYSEFDRMGVPVPYNMYDDPQALASYYLQFRRTNNPEEIGGLYNKANILHMDNYEDFPTKEDALYYILFNPEEGNRKADSIAERRKEFEEDYSKLKGEKRKNTPPNETESQSSYFSEPKKPIITTEPFPWEWYALGALGAGNTARYAYTNLRQTPKSYEEAVNRSIASNRWYNMKKIENAEKFPDSRYQRVKANVSPWTRNKAKQAWLSRKSKSFVPSTLHSSKAPLGATVRPGIRGWGTIGSLIAAAGMGVYNEAMDYFRDKDNASLERESNIRSLMDTNPQYFYNKFKDIPEEGQMDSIRAYVKDQYKLDLDDEEILDRVQSLYNAGAALEAGFGNRKALGGDLSYMQFLPVIGNGIQTLTDTLGLTNKSNYEYADTIASLQNTLPLQSFSPVGKYREYVPFDREYAVNKLSSQARANAGHILNTSGGNRATAQAGLSALNYGSQNALGNLYRQAEEFNASRKDAVIQFNNALDFQNAQLRIGVENTNNQIRQARNNYILQSIQERLREDMATSQARNTNRNLFLKDLAEIGKASQRANSIESIFPNVKYNPYTGKYSHNPGATPTGLGGLGTKELLELLKFLG